MTYILSDPDFYNLPVEEANQVSANSYSMGQVLTIPIVLFTGFLYDLIGRKPTACGTILIGAVTVLLIPIVSPSILAYDVCRILFVAQMTVILSNPFVNDYAKV